MAGRSVRARLRLLHVESGLGRVRRSRHLRSPASSHLDMLQRDLGAAKYAQIYAQAQDIRYKVDTGDWDGLQQYLKIKD